MSRACRLSESANNARCLMTHVGPRVALATHTRVIAVFRKPQADMETELSKRFVRRQGT
jgi:hypothetical protein